MGKESYQYKEDRKRKRVVEGVLKIGRLSEEDG
jgi:hypothetical protein